ncbi:uncharacterized protein LOC122921380 [Bufo gargarizans]|uniref:uncharacterized protein LOC122921380 n=1 Tax=Bufo gargarizans TaxID=30331 RepID=UPI001CF2B739|nr:uncharacterized protein LOC122921380 [Bufo gargarizans]
MSALLWMVSVSFLVDQTKAALLTYVTLDPDWRTIFKGEKISLTCNVVSSSVWKEERFYWYRDDQPLYTYQQTIQIKSAKMEYSGNYQCRTSSSDRSDPLRLDVSNDWVILQVPSYIYEGDKLLLNCRGWDSLFSNQVTIYKDDHIIGTMGYYMDGTRSGIYKCKKTRVLSVHTSKETYLIVNELFSVPILQLKQPLVAEGDEMTLTCHTTLAPRKRNTKLQFAFYRNEQRLQEFSADSEYSVSSAKHEHSGKYFCEARALLSAVTKKSDVVNIQIEEIFKTPVIQVFPSSTVSRGEQVVLRCVAASPTGNHILYSFFKDSQIVRDYTTNNTYLIPRAGDDHSGNYRCSSKPANNKVIKYSKDLSIMVEVLGQPRFMLVPDKVVIGDEITLRCEASKSLHYSFYHNRTILGNVTVSQKKSAEIRRIIKSATMTGPYYCESRNSISPTILRSETVTLFILDPVANVSIHMEKSDEDFVFGEPITLSCSSQRGTSPSFLWLHNETAIEQGSQFYQLIDNQKRLHIDSLQIHHSGTYRCVARNKLPPDRTFSVRSAPRIISVLEPRESEILLLRESSVPLIALGVLLLLTIPMGVLSFMYRQKMASLFRRCALQRPKTERTIVQARIAQDPANDGLESSGQGDYSNVPPRGHVECEDICYAHIDINQAKEASPHWNKGNEELSVTYSAVKSLQSSTDPRSTQEISGCTDLYQNFNLTRLHWVTKIFLPPLHQKGEVKQTVNIEREMEMAERYIYRLCIMPVLTLLILISSIMENSGNLVHYMVTVTPNWNHIYTEDSVTLKCDIGPDNDIRNYNFYWYKNKKEIIQRNHEFTISSAKSNDAGLYECGTGSDNRSHSLHLYVISKDVVHYMLSLTPNWNHIYRGDSVTLKCDIGPNNDIRNYNFYWYKGSKDINKNTQEITIGNAGPADAGEYECWATSAGRSHSSHSLHLYVTGKKPPELILQTPPNIVEGDSLDARCHSSQFNDKKTITFYKDGNKIQESTNISYLSNVNKSMNGIYRCEKKTQSEKLAKSGETFIFVQDLFTSPEIKVPSSIEEGSTATLRCDTRQNPLRRGTELQVSFYRNGEKVQEFGSSNEYRIMPAQWQHSGKYTCGVQTPLGTVMKMSKVSYISITGAVNKPKLTLLTSEAAVGDYTTLQCESSKGSPPIHYLFYHNQTLLGKITTHQKEIAELNLTIESMTMGGLYYCASYNDIHDQHQVSEEANLLVIEPVANINLTTYKEGEDFVLGESLTLICSVRHVTSISISWKHNETLVEQTSALYQLQDNGTVLYIQSLQYHHRGTYRCEASTKLSVNRTFCVISEIQNVNVLELSAVDYSIQLSALGILLLVIILAIVLTLMYREKIVGGCRKKPSSTGLNTFENNEDKQQTAAIPEIVYENVPLRENVDEDCTYITVKATKAPSVYPPTAIRENVTVLYSVAKCSMETSETKTDQKSSETSDSNCIYHTITADNINDHHQ